MKGEGLAKVGDRVGVGTRKHLAEDYGEVKVEIMAVRNSALGPVYAEHRYSTLKT